MLTFQWNALRVGDHVLVHDDLDPAFHLSEGTVALVEARRGGPRSVSVRNDATGKMERPRRHAVHLRPLDAQPCWRCASVAAPDVLR